MRINDNKLGQCYLEVQVEVSTVDSYLLSGYSALHDRELTDDELNEIQERYDAEIQQYAWENGSRNHN